MKGKIIHVLCLNCVLFHRQMCEEKRQKRLLERSTQEEEGAEGVSRKRLRSEVQPSPLRLVVDCSFDSLMMFKVKHELRAMGLFFQCKT